MRVTTEGLEELNSYEPSPEPYFNENVGAWDDGLGHFSYDDGATWGDARSYAAAPAPVSTAGAMESFGNTYSLNGPAFDDFNIGNMGQRYDDGLGHYTLDGGASWLNSDGTPYVDAAAQQWQAGMEYQPQYEMPGGGVYEEPGSGNRWYNGLWYDPSGNIWDDKFSQWMTPDQYQQAWQAIMEHDNAAPFDSGPAFTSDPSGNPWGSGRETVAPEPGATSFWGNQETFALPGREGGGLWGGFKNALGNIAEVGTVPYQLANEVADRLTGSTEQERWESNVSGNQFADLVTGGRADLEDLPYGLGYVTDAALAPATWLTAGVGPSVPVLGSTFSGNVGKRLAGEIAVGAAGNKGSEMGAEYAPQVIPNFSVPNIDAEILGRDVLLGDEALNFLGSDAGQSVAGGIAGGLLGGVGAYGGLKGLDAALNLGAVDEAIPSIYKASPFRVGDEAQFPAFAKDITVPPGRAIPQVAGAADDALPPKPPTAAADTALNEPRRKLLDALDEQRRFRESGQADEIIHAVRVQQAKGIAAATENLGDTFAESLDAMSAGARVGKMLPTGQSLGLDDATTLSLLKEAIEFNGGKQFDNFRAAKALSKLQNGEKLQPGEIKMLGQIYGDEVARAIRETNAGRIATVAELTPDDIVKINEQARVDGKRAAVLEAQARRQHELADDLQRQARMDPTNKRLAKAVDDARARAIAKENEADRVLAERAKTLERKQLEKAEQARIKEAQAGTKAALSEEEAAKQAFEAEWARDLTSPLDDPFGEMVARRETREMDWLGRQQDRLKADNWEKTQNEWARGLDDPTADDYARRLARGEQSNEKWLAEQQDKAHRAQMQSSNKARLTASDEQSINFAKNVVARMDASDDLKSALVDSIDLAVERNRQVLDGFGEDGPGIVRTLYAVATGEVADSYTAALLMQEANLRSALEMQGMTPQMARGAAKLVREAEIKRRFGAEVPEWVTRSLDQAKPASYQSVRDDPVAALASLSQTIKNTQFGIGDLAVFGQQVLKAGTTNSAAILSGIVNRTLGVVGVKPLGDITEGLGKRVAYQLDGVVQGARGASVDLSQQKTLFSALGKPGRIFDEKALVPATQKLTDFQFGTVLGGLRNLIYEGNLLMAKAAGADITDAAVRRNAAAFANAATGAGQLAQRTSRANVEKAFALSASMRRAQAQQMGQVARLLSPTASRETRVLAAATIASAGAATYAVGKWINDWIGVEPFEFDPSKPGFGNITLADGTVVNLFPQEQLPKAMARSIGILAREGFGEEQAKDIAKEWGKLLISSQSPAMRPILGSIGVGYDPGRGYAWGDLGKGKDWKERTLDMAPLPPITTQIAREGVGKVLTTANVLGVNAYTESQYDKIDRQVKNDPTYGGRGYSALSPIEKQEVQEKYGKLEPFGPEGERAAEVLAKKIEQQTASDTMRSQGVLDPEQWRRDYQARKDELRITNDEIYAELRKSGKLETKDPILKPYYAAMAAAEGPDGKLDWDKVDAYRATLTPAESEYISKNTGLIKIDTPAVREFEAVRDRIEASGYFDRLDENWHNVAYYVPTWDGDGRLPQPVNPKDFAHYDDWRSAALKVALDSVGATLDDIGTVTQINAWLNQQKPAEGMEAYGKKWTDQWSWENQEVAYEAWRYGYYNPRKAIKEGLAAKFE
jgi:hypothetical protein